MTERGRSWIIVINNYTDEDVDTFIELDAEYHCFGFEQGEQGTEHIQGYAYFDQPVTLTKLKKVFPRAHLEKANGNSKVNRDYCAGLVPKKGNKLSEDFYEFGELPMQGRAHWDIIKHAMKNPKDHPHIAQQYSKLYRTLKYCKKKDHVRILVVCPSSLVIECAKRYKSVAMPAGMKAWELYDNENAMFVDYYPADSKEDYYNAIINWYNGYPPKIKRGYEILSVDPEYMVLVYDSLSEKNAIAKRYGDMIDEFYESEKESPIVVEFSDGEIDT